jgi:hypothetical protein
MDATDQLIPCANDADRCCHYDTVARCEVWRGDELERTEYLCQRCRNEARLDGFEVFFPDSP